MKHFYSEDDPTSIFWPLFQGRTCLPTTSPGGSNCTHGGFPVYAVNVSSVSQIQLAINFARNANLRLVIKNTGHCYLGKSSGAGALSIWMHNLKNLQYFPDLRIPGYSGPAFKVGAGVTVREVYKLAHSSGVSALGGIAEVCHVNPPFSLTLLGVEREVDMRPERGLCWRICRWRRSLSTRWPLRDGSRPCHGPGSGHGQREVHHG